MNPKGLVAIIVLATFAVGLSGCKATDVVGKESVASFEALMNRVSDKVKFDDAKGRWIMASPDGEQFEWSKDFSSDKPDVVIEFSAVPFINAGLDVKKLPQDKYLYEKSTDRIIMPYEIGRQKFTYTDQATSIETYKKIVDTNREKIGYHGELDHYGIDLGNGNMFEWAKDMKNNDKDIVFVLNPQPFIDADVDPSKIEGWVFAKVKVKNEKGKMVEVDKILKPYNLE